MSHPTGQRVPSIVLFLLNDQRRLNMPEVRNLKVSSQPKPRTGYVPNIRLAGEWLRKAGIEIGQRVTIEVHPGQIIIHTAS